MKVTIAVILLTLSFSGLIPSARTAPPQQAFNTTPPQTVTLYPPYNKATGKYDETRACFSFKLGNNKLPKSTDWDLGYGFAHINNEDWLLVGTTASDKRSVMKELGEYQWIDNFEIPALEPLPKLEKGERRQITVDSSGDSHQQWAKTTSHFAKAKPDYMYLMRVKDDQTDIYVLFRVEELEQQNYCTISWKLIPAPRK